MREDRGFSLLEMMVSVSISAVLLSMFFLAMGQLRHLHSDLNHLLERDRNLWLAPLLLSRWVLPAGNNSRGQEWAGVSGDSGRLELKTDSDGALGFPDLALSSPFEVLALKSSGQNLMAKNGGGNFQPVLKNVSSLASDTGRLPLLLITLRSATDHPLSGGNTAETASTFTFMVRNYRPTLFPEVTR